jgi:deoxycytidylate deaminase
MYVALFPCNECAKMIIQSGITEVVYLSDKYKETASMRASRRMMSMAKVRARYASSICHSHSNLHPHPHLYHSFVQLCLRQYTPSQREVTIDFSQIQADQAI